MKNVFKAFFLKSLLTSFLFFVISYFLSLPAKAVTKTFPTDSLTKNVVYNPYQGLGVCHWASPTIMDDPVVSWAYDATGATLWNKIEPLENQFDWSGLDGLVQLAKSKGKKIWLQIYNNGDTVPQWALGKTVDGEKIIQMGTPNPPNYDCTTMNRNVPLPWSKAYLALWRKIIHKMAERYDNEPAVEAIIMMAGGGYGEMTVCSTCGPPKCWAQLGGCGNNDQNCVDNKFTDAVKSIIDLYLEKEHVWGSEGVLPPGTKTHGFLNKPVILQLGGGVYHHANIIVKKVVDYALPKYGMRVLLKTNGWHCGSCDNTPCDWGHGSFAANYLTGNNPTADRTKYGLEPASLISNTAEFQSMVNCSNNISYACLQPYYWEDDRLEKFRTARENLAKGLGARVLLGEITYPDSITAGQAYDFSLKMKNLDSLPPFRPKRTEVNGVPKDGVSSYELALELIKNEEIAFRKTIELTPPSINWTENQEISLSSLVTIPANIASGEYELRVALFDPEAKERFRQEYFRFSNKNLLDSAGRAKIGLVAVQGGSVPSPTQPPENNSLKLQASFEGIRGNPALAANLEIKGSLFQERVIFDTINRYQTIPKDSLPSQSTYLFTLYSFPYLKKSISLSEELVRVSNTLLNFGTLKTGDFNADNIVNGLDWSIMKQNYGLSGEE